MVIQLFDVLLIALQRPLGKKKINLYWCKFLLNVLDSRCQKDLGVGGLRYQTSVCKLPRTWSEILILFTLTTFCKYFIAYGFGRGKIGLGDKESSEVGNMQRRPSFACKLWLSSIRRNVLSIWISLIIRGVGMLFPVLKII